MASFAITTLFSDERTKRGMGRYWRAVRDATVADGCDECIDIESLLCMELGDLGRSLILKYPLSASSASSVIMIKSCNVSVARLLD